jgi:flagellar motor switch protein FliM
MELFDFGTAPGLPGQAHRTVTARLAVTVPRVGLVLSSMVRRSIEASSGDLQPVALTELDGPSTSWLRAHYAEGDPAATAVAVLADQAVVALADLLMGGPGYADGRVPTAMELRIVAGALTRALVPVAEALGPFGVESLSLTPSSRDETGARTALVRLPITITAGEVEAELSLVLPAALFADASDVAALPMAAAPDVDAALRTVPVTVEVSFAPLAVPAGELEDLAVGDVIRLDHPVESPLFGSVDGRPLFLAQPGSNGRAIAVEVVDFLEESRR